MMGNTALLLIGTLVGVESVSAGVLPTNGSQGILTYDGNAPGYRMFAVAEKTVTGATFTTTEAAMTTTEAVALVTTVPNLTPVPITNPVWSTNQLVTTTLPGSNTPVVVPFIAAGAAGVAGAGTLLFGFFEGIDIAEAAAVFDLGDGIGVFSLGEGGTPVAPDDGDPVETDPENDLDEDPEAPKEEEGDEQPEDESEDDPAPGSTCPIDLSTAAQPVSAAAEDADNSDDEATCDGDNTKVRRSIAGRIEYDQLFERAQCANGFRQKPPVSSLGSCVNFVPAATIPLYNQGFNLIGYQPANGNNAQLWYIPNFVAYSSNIAGQISGIKQVTTPGLTGAGYFTGNTQVNINVGGRSDSTVNVDHVYEISLLKDFMDSQLTNNPNFDCGDFNTLFLAIPGTAPANNGQPTRLQTIWNQYPGQTNGGLAGTYAKLNEIKGSFFNTGNGGIQNYNSGAMQQGGACSALRTLYFVSASMEMIHDPTIQQLFVAGNTRVYNAFQGIDQAINCANPPMTRTANGQPLQPTWAAAYSSWIDTYTASREADLFTFVSSVSASISAEVSPTPAPGTPPGAPPPNPFPAEQASFNAWVGSPWGQANFFTFQLPFVWPTTGAIQMRDLNVRQADTCPAPAPAPASARALAPAPAAAAAPAPAPAAAPAEQLASSSDGGCQLVAPENGTGYICTRSKLSLRSLWRWYTGQAY
ncbi:MAG: hypothetical protein M1827_003636 [Pycnora praestabilis]|nr:MAG: hypothetical protein M1827_003636 [Pycnora praestabilis]